MMSNALIKSRVELKLYFNQLIIAWSSNITKNPFIYCVVYFGCSEFRNNRRSTKHSLTHSEINNNDSRLMRNEKFYLNESFTKQILRTIHQDQTFKHQILPGQFIGVALDVFISFTTSESPPGLRGVFVSFPISAPS